MKRVAALLLLASASEAGAAPPADDAAPAPAPAPQGLPPMRPRAWTPAPSNAPGMVAPVQARQALVDDTTPNMFAQVLVGGAMGVAGLYLGGLVGYEVECAGGCPGDFGGLGGALVGAGVGITAAATAGVALVGHDRDHDASIALTVVGSVLGGGIALAAVGKSLDEHPEAAVTVLSCSAALGGALMYRITWTRNPAKPAAAPATALRLVPYATGRGVGVSLVGTTF